MNAKWKDNIESENIVVRKKNFRNLRIIIKHDTSVIINIPYGVDENTVNDFINRKLTWINRKLVEMRKRKSVESNENIFRYKGYNWNIKVIKSNNDEIIFTHGSCHIYLKNIQNINYRIAFINDFINREAFEIFSEKLEKWSNITKLHFEGFRVKEYKSMWGNCDRRKKIINLNINLIREKDDFIDYVILHEIIHLKISGHGKDFYSEIAKFMPDFHLKKKR